MGILNLFIKKQKKEEAVDVEKDLNAIVDYFKELPPEINNVLKHFFEFKVLIAKEKKLISNNASESEIKDIVEQQVKKYDELLKDYELFELDADINGQRIKKISKAILQKAMHYHINPLMIDNLKKSERWSFNW